MRGHAILLVLSVLLAEASGCDLGYLQRNVGHNDAAVSAPDSGGDGPTLSCGSTTCAATATQGCCSPNTDSLHDVYFGPGARCSTVAACPAPSILATCQGGSDCLSLDVPTPVCCLQYLQDDAGGNVPGIASISCVDATACPTDMSERLCEPGIAASCPPEDTCEMAPSMDSTYKVIEGFFVCR